MVLSFEVTVSVSISLRGRLTTKFVGVSQILTQGPQIYGPPGHPSRGSGGMKWEFTFQSSRLDRISQDGNECFDIMRRGFKVCEEKGHVAVGRRRKADLSASWRGNTKTKGHTERDKGVVRK